MSMMHGAVIVMSRIDVGWTKGDEGWTMVVAPEVKDKHSLSCS